MEILACPMCKNPDLELLIFEEDDQEIENGLINCSKCLRYYPIRNTIPVMLPDDMRKQSEDVQFLKKYQSKISASILDSGKPFSLKDS